MTEVEHRTRAGDVRFRIKVLDEGTPSQRLSVTAEYWVEDTGFSKLWGVIDRDGTKALAEALSAARYPSDGDGSENE